MKEFKLDHDLKMQVQYDDVFKPTTLVQRGKKDQSKFLASVVCCSEVIINTIYFCCGILFEQRIFELKKKLKEK